MIINHNLNAMNAYRNMAINMNNASKSMERLSSGLRINRAGDDAAGLAISEKMRAQIRGLDQAARNAQDGISMLQTAEGALNETHLILQRMRELAVQSSSDTNTQEDRSKIQKENIELLAEINRIANQTEFNTQKMLDTPGGITFNIQVGANAGQSIALAFSDMQTSSLGINSINLGVDYTTSTAAIETIDNAIKLVSNERAEMGAKQNRLEHTINNLNTSSENLSAAESRIRDADIAKEMMDYTRNNILVQVAQAMLAQANTQAQGILQLLK